MVMIGNLTTGSKAMKRRLIEERESAIRNYAAAMAQFKEEGREEERAKADEEKREMARGMLSAGLSFEQVSKISGLSIEDLKIL